MTVKEEVIKTFLKNGYPVNSPEDVAFIEDIAKRNPKLQQELGKVDGKTGAILKKSKDGYTSIPINDKTVQGMSAQEIKAVGNVPTNKDQVQSAVEDAPQDVKDQVDTATAALQNPSETGTSSGDSQKDAQDAVNNLLNSDNPLAKMFGNVLKALLGAMGMYKSEETADSATDTAKESSPENRVQKIDEMVKKGEESKTYFPAKISEKGLEDIPPVDPKNQKSADAADKAKAERTTYILDTRKALGLPIDKTEKNVYDAEVMAKVKEIQKKAGSPENGLFDKGTAKKYQEALKAENLASTEKKPEAPKA